MACLGKKSSSFSGLPEADGEERRRQADGKSQGETPSEAFTLGSSFLSPNSGIAPGFVLGEAIRSSLAIELRRRNKMHPWSLEGGIAHEKPCRAIVPSAPVTSTGSICVSSSTLGPGEKDTDIPKERDKELGTIFPSLLPTLKYVPKSFQNFPSIREKIVIKKCTRK